MIPQLAGHWRGVLQLAFPVAVVLDTLHSLWRIRQLAASRYQVKSAKGWIDF